MDFAFIQDLNIPPWAPVLAAFIFGAIFGWLVKGLPENDDDVSVRDRVRQKAAQIETGELDSGEHVTGEHVNGNLEVDEEGKSFLPIERSAPDGMKIGALESELRKMQELFESQELEQKETGQHLVDIDNALKRANGRLKLIIGAVKKAASRR